jgi:hypothetical protein
MGLGAPRSLKDRLYAALLRGGFADRPTGGTP